ncbi:MAG: (2Fe-2S)-binding protein [Polyangiaceae bacterium]|nr:(2Fe-2S)-binding protein [Polyangiaceae bacterium]
MYVCLCKGVSDRAIRGCIRRGAGTVGAVGAECGAGTDCGSCRGMIADLIEEEQEQSGVHMHLPVLASQLA